MEHWHSINNPMTQVSIINWILCLLTDPLLTLRHGVYKQKRELSPSLENLPPAKWGTHKLQDVLRKYVTIQFCSVCALIHIFRSTKHCIECNRLYSSARSHKAVCTRNEVPCIYPNLHSESDSHHITLHRVDGSFKCIHCGKLIKKVQNMKVTSFSNG